LKTWYLIQCGVKYRLAMTNTLFRESHIGGANINSSMDLRSIGNLLEMSTPNVESSLSQSFKSSNGITTSIWIRSPIMQEFSGALILSRRSLQGPRVIPFDHFINNDLEYLRGGASSRKYKTSVTKTKAADYGHIKWIKGLVPRTICSQAPISYDKYALWGISHWGCNLQKLYGSTVNMESARDVYLKHKIIAVIELQSVKWHDYRHLDWITMHRDDDKLYKFKEGDFNRLRIQDIEDILLLLNKEKQNRLMWIDELHKYTDGTLNDVRTALDDRIKGIRMMYLPQTIWRRSDKERAATMIHAINKQLKTRRIMRSLEKFVGRRLYEGDFRML
nr:hypothetical protein [Tanacetum cinerariifolium]